MTLSRRYGGRTVGLVIAALLLLAGCGTGPDDPGGPSAGNGFPVVLQHVFGSTTVPKAAARVVTLGISDADAVLALGITPVAVTGMAMYPDGLGPWAKARVEGTAPVRIASESKPDLEQIAALRPDLILAIASGIDESTYQALSRIAPTVARPQGSSPYRVPRDTATTVIARALGKPSDGAALVARAHESFARAARENPSFAGRTASVVLPYDGKYSVYFAGDARGRVMTELGFVVPPQVAAADDGKAFHLDVSLERIAQVDADVVVMLATEPAARAAVDRDRLLHAVPAVAAGRMILPDVDTRGAMTYDSVLSVPFALDRLVPELARVLPAR